MLEDGPEAGRGLGRRSLSVDKKKRAEARPLETAIYDQASMTSTISSVRGFTTTILSLTRKYS
jgi:hypothetical protein